MINHSHRYIVLNSNGAGLVTYDDKASGEQFIKNATKSGAIGLTLVPQPGRGK